MAHSSRFMEIVNDMQSINIDFHSWYMAFMQKSPKRTFRSEVARGVRGNYGCSRYTANKVADYFLNQW